MKRTIPSNKDHPSAITDLLDQEANRRVDRLHSGLITILLLIMGVNLILNLIFQNWFSLFLITFIMIILMLPILFRKQHAVDIPAEFHLISVIFAVASLYLGEVQMFYIRFWWWDLLLHSSAGFLLGVVGFLLAYLLNESRRIELSLTSGFIAFFAFTFAVSIGTIWEMFEFGMDEIVQTRMQKPMLGDDSGLTDTMFDVILNMMGATAISVMGYLYMKRDERFFVRRWIRRFAFKNPKLFKD
jgi:hypothetical protein